MRQRIFIILMLIEFSVHAFSWQDLWATDDQQAQVLMNKGQYKLAEKKFRQTDWKASAAYRAGNYQQAAREYESLKSEQGYYNQGNALAHLGQYEAAIKAYDQALRLNSHNEDALYNRKIVQALLKKDKQKEQDNDQQSKDQRSQKDKNQQAKDQQNQSKDQQSNDQKNQQNKNQQNQKNKDQQGQDQQNQQTQQEKLQDKGEQEKNQRANNQKVKPVQNDKKNKGNKKQMTQPEAQQTTADKEKQLAKEQWLRLIPDDPGGLMREKFLRDHLRRQRGWYQ